MVVNLIKDKQMFSMTLPNKVKGQYWVTDFDQNSKIRNFISIEAVDNEWCVKSNKNVSVLDSSNKPIDNTILKNTSFLNLKVKDCDERVLLFSEPISTDRQTFSKVLIKNSCELTIGRTSDNNICFENKYASGKHAKLVYDGTAWSITDLNSTNGTFVNGYRTTSQLLEIGDYIYIMGLKVIIGNQFIAINNPDNLLRLNCNRFLRFETQKINGNHVSTEIENTDYFYRSPRFKRDYSIAEMVIDPPPAVQKVDQVPLALMLGPSLTMGLTSLSTGILTLSNVVNNGGQISQALPTLFMSVSMLLGTILWPILTKRHEKKQRRINEKKRQEKYLEYLNGIRDEIKRKCKEQSDILNENIVTPDECVERITSAKRNLWERSIEHDDFLKLRVGIGNLPLDAIIKYPEKRFSMEDDNLQDALLSLGNEPKNLQEVPVSISLLENYITGIIGNRHEVLSLIKNLILQLIALHSYDELKLIFILDKEELAEWEFVKWIPHIWNEEKSFRFLATDLDDIKEISAYLEKNILSRVDDEKTKYSSYLPYYLIISGDKNLADKCEALGQLTKYKSNQGFSIISLYDEIQNLPKETMSVLDINGNQSRIFDKDDLSGKSQIFIADSVNHSVLNAVSESIANIHMDLSSQRFSLPGMITFLEMFNVGKIEHLNSLTRWKENNPTITLQTPVGVDTFGESFLLDLHEKFHGPHGLVAGMTGSGKSEFIITYILSLAVNYHPDEVAFILIDYKGGGLTGAFEDKDRGIKLPHLAGTITNLDGAAVKRSLISIQSELRRRQAVFNEARRNSNEGTMDIYKYQQLYREKVVAEPIPHLFIISDEFAELKSQQPEFMEQLISAARIGRSLGVHLILATQKPSGVVDDQIWSNSKFRVCLKVQEKQDSQEMIKRPDAAELSQTGRFYLQVGYNELFALGQSAWCGAKYVPTETVEKNIDSSVQIIDNLGRVIRETKPAKKVTTDVAKIKQVVGIVKYLSDLALEECISERPLWLEPISEFIYIDELEKKYTSAAVVNKTILNPIIGEYDDPFNQSQKVLTLPLSKDGNTVIYGATGNGKTTLLTTMIYSLIKHHSADELNLYIMDFGSETLRAFDKAPQVGGVLFSQDEEKIINLMKMLGSEIETRKQLFANFGGDYSSYSRNSSNIIPNIVVFINNYAAFSEQFEDLEEQFLLLSRDGIKYGIYFVLTAGATNTVRYRTLQNFRQLLSLQLNDENDYSIVLGKTDGVIPSKYKGRGLVGLDRIYEFQTAYPTECTDQYEFIRNYCAQQSKEATTFAKLVPILPKRVSLEVVKNDISGLVKIPVGVGKKSLQTTCMNLSSQYIYPVLASDIYQIQYFAECFAKVCVGSGATVSVLDSEVIFAGDSVNGVYYKSEDFEEDVQNLFAEVAERNNAYKDAKMNSKSLEKYEERIIIITGIKRLFDQLSDDGKDKLQVMFERGEALYKIRFVMIDAGMNLNMFSSESWYRRHISGSEGIWIGDGFTDQYVIKANKITSELYEEIGDEFGYLLRRNKPTLIKLLTSKPLETEGDENE